MAMLAVLTQAVGVLKLKEKSAKECSYGKRGTEALTQANKAAFAENMALANESLRRSRDVASRLALTPARRAWRRSRVKRLQALAYTAVLEAAEAIEVTPEQVFNLQRKNGFADFAEQNIKASFRFHTKEQLQELMDRFQIPAEYVLEEGQAPNIRKRKVPGELFLLVGLWRLHYGNNLWDGRELFGIADTTFLNKVSNKFIDWMYQHWRHLVLDHLTFWKPYFPSFAEAIRQKMHVKSDNQLHYARGQFEIAAFIDNSMAPTCRPGGGPVAPGPNARRHDPLIQQAFYTGWKKVHGVKMQTVDGPNGMTLDAFGPVSVRRNDLYPLAQSDINGKFARLQAGNPIEFKMYGDSIYPILSHLRSRYVGNANHPLTRAENVENETFSACRETIEWNYGRFKSRWAYLDYKKKLKLRARKFGVRNAIVVALILENAYTCLNHNETTHYFNPDLENPICLPPTLAEWTAVGPRP